MANYDELTDLPNRRKLIIDGREYIAQIREDEDLYVLFFDIDGFKKLMTITDMMAETSFL